MADIIESCVTVVPVPMGIVESRDISDSAFRVFVAIIGMSLSGGGTLDDVADLLDIERDIIDQRVEDLVNSGILSFDGDRIIYSVNLGGDSRADLVRRNVGSKVGRRKKLKKVSLAAAQAAIANARATAEAIHKEQAQKRAARKRVSVTTRIYDHWSEKCKERWPDFKLRPWGAKDRSLAKRLVADYGEERVKKVISWAIDNWDIVAAKLNLMGILNMSILMGYQDTIFPWAEMGDAMLLGDNAHGDEYKSDREDSDNGWGGVA